MQDFNYGKIPTAKEMTLLHALQQVGARASAKQIQDYMPDSIDASGASSRLCKARNKGWVTAEMENGVNQWTLTDEGRALLPVIQIAAEYSSEQKAPRPVIEPEFTTTYSALAAEISRLQKRGSLERSEEATWLLRALGDYHQPDAPTIHEELYRIADWIENRI